MKKLLLILTIITLPYVGFAQLAKYQALYLYNFTRYIEWPTEYQSGDFTIGVVGSSTEIGAELLDIASKRKVSNQSLVIEEFSSVKQIKKCHILFITKKKMGDYAAIVAAAKKYNTLIVTEESYTPDNAAINMIYADKKLKYDVNKPALAQAGLKISDRLLAISN